MVNIAAAELLYNQQKRTARLTEYLFLEQDSAETNDWVREQNEHAESVLCDAQFEADRDVLAGIYKATDKLVVPRSRGEWEYHFLEDADHQKGLWRRRKVGDVEWLPVFDFDAFCAKADEKWEWRGAVTCRWKPERVLIALSLGGSDKIAHFEFDCDAGEFVEGGFKTEPARTHISWASCDSLLVAGGPVENSATKSGWPRVVRHWQRDEILEDAVVVFDGSPDDVTVISWCVGSKDKPLQILMEHHTIGRTSLSVGYLGKALAKVDLPVNVEMVCEQDYFAFVPKDADGDWKQGSLVLGAFAQDLSSPPKFRTIIEPGERSSVDSFFLLKDWLVYTVSKNLKPEIYVLELGPVDSEPQKVTFPTSFEIVSVLSESVDDVELQNTLIASCSGPLTPSSLFRFEAGGIPVLVDQAPERFDATGMSVEVLEAESGDGEMIPYHLVRPASVEGPVPTVIYGYGGFNISTAPNYNPTAGSLWLARGGAYVFAHVRGGSEFGPQWHDDAKGPDKKPVSYMDLAAISRDLTKRNLAAPEQIGVTGGSNGGLMVGVMLVNYPQDFGAIWSVVPVLDLKRFATFPAGVAWIDEYGDPENAEDWEKMKNYSPYHLVEKDKQYPPVYFATSATDDRVHPSHARRMVAKMLGQGHAPLFHETTDGGHGGGDLTKAAARNAMGFGFFQKTLMGK